MRNEMRQAVDSTTHRMQGIQLPIGLGENSTFSLLGFQSLLETAFTRLHFASTRSLMHYENISVTAT